MKTLETNRGNGNLASAPRSPEWQDSLCGTKITPHFSWKWARQASVSTLSCLVELGCSFPDLSATHK